MPGIDKAAFLKRIGSKKPEGYGGSMPGAPPDDEAAEGESADLSCGEQLMAGIKSGDAAVVDAALREAVQKYGG
jgi:hypothetical protein